MNQPNYSNLDSSGTHSRSDTTLVKDINQSYQFISALDKCEDESSRFDYFVTAPEYPCSELSEDGASTVTLKPFESVTEIRRNSRRGSSIDMFDGPSKYIPKKLYCPRCKAYQDTRTNYCPQQTSFWKRLLCNECFSHGTQYQAIYSCKVCKFILTKVNCSFKA